MSGAGKGSKPRKVDFNKYAKNYDTIFAKNKTYNSKESNNSKLVVK